MPDAVPKRWLADFTVWSSLKLPAASPTLQFTHSGGLYVAHLENAPADATDFTLRLRLVMPGDTLQAAHDVARPLADSFLHLMSFITQTPFRVVKLNRVIDWTPGVADRELFIYYVRPADQIVGELAEPFVQSAQTIEASGLSELTVQALRWFAAAVRAPIMADQFQYFWFVVELLAASAGAERVTDKCTHCRTDLHCPICNGPSTHRPYPAQRIRQFLMSLGLEEDVVDGIESCRHRLMHGATQEQLEAHCQTIVDTPRFQDVIDQLGQAAWGAITTTFNLTDEQARSLHLAGTESFVPYTMTLRLHARVGYPGEPQDPSMDNLHVPNVEADVVELDDNGNEIRRRL